jgi:hypothetical protein
MNTLPPNRGCTPTVIYEGSSAPSSSATPRRSAGVVAPGAKKRVSAVGEWMTKENSALTE